MPKLSLVFKNEDGEEKRVEVERTPFTIGRHSGCDLTIVDSRLSREHLKIELREDKFVVSDLGSSNGTTINGEKLSDPVGLKNDDKLNLGGIEIGVEAEEADESGPEMPSADVPSAAPEAPSADARAPAGAATAAAVAAAPASGGGGGIPTAFFILAPLLGLFVIGGIVVTMILLGGGDKKRTASGTGDYEISSGADDVPAEEDEKPAEEIDTPAPPRSPTPVSTGTPSTGGPAVPSTTPPPFVGSDNPPAGGASEAEKIERNGAAFLRQAALKDERAFLTGEQASAVSTVVKRVKSPALADNITSARKNASAIKSLAASKGLKPQFLAVAAITKLGDGRGDVLQAAQGIVEVYDKLAIPVGNDNSDDVLLMVAAYDQGVAGEFLKLRDLMVQLAKKDEKTAAREVRSIWYLKRTGNLAPADYDRALSFLAIGTIAQNPKEFGVNAEALRL